MDVWTWIRESKGEIIKIEGRDVPEENRFDKSETMVIELKEGDRKTLNTLRRIMMSQIPTIAIEYVEISHNNGAMKDEMIAMLLGQIPLNVDPDTLDFVREQIKFDHGDLDTASFKADNSVIFKLDVTYSQEKDFVTSGDLVWDPLPGQEELFRDKPPRPLYDNINITRLLPGQRLSFRAIAIKGIPSSKAGGHMKWRPVSQVTVARPQTPEIISGKVRPTRGLRKEHLFVTIESTGVLTPEKILESAWNIYQIDPDVVKPQRFGMAKRSTLGNIE